MTVPGWVRPYVGIPFVERGRDLTGCDCWGLCRIVMSEQWGVDLPSYGDDYLSATDKAHLDGVIRGQLEPWIAIARGQERAGDLALMRVYGVACHIGLIVAPGWMLHVSVDHESLCERYDGLRFARATEGIYRHPEMVANAA